MVVSNDSSADRIERTTRVIRSLSLLRVMPPQRPLKLDRFIQVCTPTWSNASLSEALANLASGNAPIDSNGQELRWIIGIRGRSRTIDIYNTVNLIGDVVLSHDDPLYEWYYRATGNEQEVSDAAIRAVIDTRGYFGFDAPPLLTEGRLAAITPVGERLWLLSDFQPGQPGQPASLTLRHQYASMAAASVPAAGLPQDETVSARRNPAFED